MLAWPNPMDSSGGEYSWTPRPKTLEIVRFANPILPLKTIIA